MQPNKGAAIRNLERQTGVTAVLRFLGVANYMARFIPNLAEIATSLRQLTHKETEGKWEAEHQEGYENIQTFLVEPPIPKVLWLERRDYITV